MLFQKNAVLLEFWVGNDTVDGSEIRLTTWDGAKTLWPNYNISPT